jgi:5-methylcytosine-specific restriction endonuclease McrA
MRPLKKELKEKMLNNKAKCAYCGKGYDNKRRRVSLDHIVPKYSFGKTELGNLVLCCGLCNNVKKLHTPVKEYIEMHPETKFFLKKYLEKCKNVEIDGKNYYDELKWIEELL